MTNEEALEILNTTSTYVKCDGCEHGLCSMCEFGQAYEVAKKTLKMQIPKKPVWIPHDGENDRYDCPTCGRPLSNEKEHHCVCGQALIWE